MFTSVLQWIKKYPHALISLYFIPFLMVFKFLEVYTVPTYYIHCFLDDMIPFYEIFIIPYFLWFPFLAFSLIYFLLHSKTEFVNLCFCMFMGMTICLFLYILFPNGLSLRVPIEHENIFADIARILYTIDTPTNVCPSIHVASTLSILYAILRSNNLRHPLFIKVTCTILSFLICLSTLFLKQHSVLDVVAAILLTSSLYLLTYHCNWRNIFSKFHIYKLIK